MNLTYTIPETKKDITVERFLSISRLYKLAEDRESEVTEIQLLSECLNIPISLVDKLPFKEYQHALKVVTEALNTESTLHLTFDLNGVKYGFIPDIENMSTGEYGTLDKLLGDADANAYSILNVLYRPVIKEKFYKSLFSKNKKGTYKIQAYNHKNNTDIFKDAPYEIYESALLFFLNLGSELVNDTQNFMSQAEQVQTIEQLGSQKNGDGIRRMIHTLQQNVSELKKFNTSLSIKYYLD